ncbi:uncharacterized protein LOC110994347 [Pieris rapae]|uniref:uncharacterized protein LOC110994347 n=1 Tax=Pieris rapae TaxID=64459 RepID=UPI001E2817BE|nr:uncharacterized protein LOC110994347 [Pieris rapae]
MPLTQEKRLDNFSNNNDHSYLHKKFKKMASTISVLPANSQKCDENVQRDTSSVQSVSNTSISNGSIAAAHPEIEKIKENYDGKNAKVENYVQINYNDENSRLNDVNNIIFSGKTSFSDEFLKKTENYENDSNRDGHSGGVGRYVCPYCKLPCAKPSVLQKHIRAHTNERPYPCVPCGFAFKTKSNLYKHRRSRTHALRSQGADINASINDEDLSGGSESDTSVTPASISDTGSDASLLRVEHSRPNEFSSPELTNDITANYPFNNDNKSKTIYKPKFRAAFYQGNEEKDKIKKNITTNADFLTEHISKIISDNEAIVDVIETPLQKKYNKIKQIAESKQFFNERDIKQELTPLNLTKNTYESENLSRKRSHSESFAGEDTKHPLNPEGSIIKDLLLKTKANGINSLPGELEDGVGPLFICPLCQIMYRSADNLEIHRLYYCKGHTSNNTSGNSIINRGTKCVRSENVYLRSNSINVRLSESQNQSSENNRTSNSPSLKNKPDNLIILKPEHDVIAPLPSPGPLLGNTRLVDTRLPVELNRNKEHIRIKGKDHSPRRRLDSRSDSYSPRLMDNVSPRSVDLYSQTKIRCIDNNSTILRSIDELQMRHNSTSLQMFGGEVKIVDHSGSTTTLRIEPSKNQLSPIMIQQNLSPSKFLSDSEASSVVVRSGLHSGGTIVHNPPTPKENINTPQTPRMSAAASNIQNSGMVNIHDITHFQFPPLSAITAYNPLTLPPLSPTSSPSGATSILHGGKIIPHVPGIPGPNTTGIYVGNTSGSLIKSVDMYKSVKVSEGTDVHRTAGKTLSLSLDKEYKPRNSKFLPMTDMGIYERGKESQKNNVPLITVKNVDDPNLLSKKYTPGYRTAICKQENHLKRNAEGSKTIISKENSNYPGTKYKNKEIINLNKNNMKEADNEINSFNFENLITKAEIYNIQIQSSSEVQKNVNAQDTLQTTHNDRSEKSYFQKNLGVTSASEDRKPKFLRPSSLPLKPGTFTPKRHHGITPNANTMPLVSPETPRPAKAYGQLYLNGNAYTYLGLKCSAKVFYCTINRPQPTYVPNQHFLSMYSNWQLLSELTADPLGLSASSAMSLYDSRHRPQTVTVAVIKQDLILTHSSQWNKIFKDKQTMASIDMKKEDNKANMADGAIAHKKELAGGFESNEEYTYVRGRGRGRYVCLECGIRCKKPSMLKKHIRTHTDVRPYTCIHCVFSFKTKGNLTKHMKSKAHYKKCCELGINPNEGNDSEGIEMHPCPEETDDESESEGDDGNEGETESSDTEFYKSRLPEHEAAHCLLSLGGNRLATTTTTPGLITSARPSTYPYSPIMSDNAVLDYHTDTIQETKNANVEPRLENDNNEPIDLSKTDSSTPSNMMEIPTARESSVLASLASNTAKLPQHQSQWVNGEPMLHTYLTERALLDSKIKQSQLASNSSKIRKIEIEKSMFNERNDTKESHHPFSDTDIKADISKNVTSHDIQNKIVKSMSKGEIVDRDSNLLSNGLEDSKRDRISSNSNSENAKQVVSEYIKHARISMMKSHEESSVHENLSDDSNSSKINVEDKTKLEEVSIDGEVMKQTEDSITSNIVIGGVSFKVNKDKEFDSSMPYSPSKLMDDGRRVCDFCNKTFTKPSQLKLHLNIHYMERPFRCSVCAVSFRTKGHLQKHERSGSHHNKVSMTSTFGAATSFNPRPFRCSDCNIAFRIHGHLAKHLRSKMHVMRLECLFKLPFGTFTEIERAGLSLTDIDTTDCASSLASLQCLARKLHEKDPSRLEYREQTISMATAPPACRESSEDEEGAISSDKLCENEIDSLKKSIENMECKNSDHNTFSATDN